VYRNRFSKGQNCWDHLLRKAIQLMLSYPKNPKYREFFEDLLAVFREGKRLQQDGRLSDVGRQRKELVRCLADAELFTFVRYREAQPTNNISERTFRDTAQARKTGRTSKTQARVKRRSVIKSVLISLGQNLPEFTLHGILAEVTRWCRTGIVLFRRQLQKLRAATNRRPIPNARNRLWRSNPAHTRNQPITDMSTALAVCAYVRRMGNYCFY
jgi:transposase